MLEKKLKWRCRRGVRELDVLLTTFVDQKYADLADEQQQAFHQLLEVQDPVIMDWLYAKERVEDEGLAFIVRQLQDLSGINKA